MTFVIFDTEYTTWAGCQESGWKEPQKKEIVQISALKVSEDLSVISEFNQLCQPQFNPELSDYFIRLTHITNETIRSEGRLFKEVFPEFYRFVGSDICFSHAWGRQYRDKADGDVVYDNLRWYQVSAPEMKFRNIAPLFQIFYQHHGMDISNQSSGQIAKILKCSDSLKKLGLDEHNALYDVYSILTGIRYFKQDFWSEFEAAEKNI